MSETKVRVNYAHVLKSLGISDIKRFQALLNFLDCPPNLLRFHVVLKNSIACLSAPLISDIEDDSELRTQARIYLKSAKELLPIVQKCQDQPKLFEAAAGTPPDKALRGIINKHPAYAMLYITDSEARSALFEFHQTLLFLQPLIARARQFDTKIELKKSDYGRMCLGFRHLMSSTVVKAYLQSNAAKADSVQRLHVYLELLSDALRKELALPLNSITLKNIRDDKLHPDHQNVLNYENAKYVRRVIGLIRKIPIQRRTVSKKNTKISTFKRGRQKIAQSMLIPFTLPELDDDEPIIYGLIEQSAEPDADAVLSGEMPDEDDSGDILIIDESIPLETYVHEYHRRRVSNDTIKRLERQNNYVPHSLQLMAPQEIQKLTLFLTSSPATNLEQIQQLALLCMFFTASPLERVMDLEIFEDVTETTILPASTIVYDISCHHWIIPAFDLGYKGEGMCQDGITPVKYLRLPASRFCANKFAIFKSQTNSYESKVIGYPLEEFKPALKNTLKKIIPGKQGSLARVSNHMLILCCQVFGQATATLLFGLTPPGSFARNYYTTLSTGVLVNRYKFLLKKLSLFINEVINQKVDISISVIPNSGFVGAQWHPKNKQVEQSVRFLKTKVVNSSSNWLTLDNWRHFHNAYTLYIVHCTAMLTGLRPIKSPILNPEHVIPSAKVFVRREKTKADEFNTRYIPLTDIVIRLMQEYEQHLLVVKGRLLRQGIAISEIPRLFFLEPETHDHYSPKLKIVPFSVSEYERRVTIYLILPVNSNRRLLRGFLETPSYLGSKLPPVPFEIIDAVLGHANIGEQYWSSSSTLSMRAIQQTIEPYLNELSGLLGIEVLPGLPA